MVQKILVAEDERPLTTALDLKLKGAGYVVRVVYNGREALDALAKDKFDFECAKCRKWRNDYSDPITRIITYPGGR